MPPERLILRSRLCPGDIVMMTAAVRDLHRAYPGRFETDVRTPCPALWERNELVTPLSLGDEGSRLINMRYPLIRESNRRPLHFIHGYARHLESELGLSVPVTEFRGDVHLSERERRDRPHPEVDPRERYWLLIAGGKHDVTAKWWPTESYQAVVDRLAGDVRFLQCGRAGHRHPRLRGVHDLVGRTTLRQFIRLMYWADGVVCPVTFAMHLAAAAPSPPGHPVNRPAVVVAGGREPTHWEAYPHHRYLSTVGALPCCGDGGCWRSKCVASGQRLEGHPANRICTNTVLAADGTPIARCMAMIRPEQVVDAVRSYYDGGVLPKRRATAATPRRSPERLLLEFPHGLGDVVQLSIVLKHLRRHRPNWEIDVAVTSGFERLLQGSCRRVMPLPDTRAKTNQSPYDRVLRLKWRENRDAEPRLPSTKPTRCLREVFDLPADEDLFRYAIHVSPQARRAAADVLQHQTGRTSGPDGRFAVCLIHHRGRTSTERKDLSDDVALVLARAAEEHGLTPLLIDRDRRSRWPRTWGVRRLNLPRSLGAMEVETLAAAIDVSAAFVGVDSGPLHVAGALNTPSLAVWTRHHPIHFFDLADHVLHAVPENHASLAAGPAAVAAFESLYRHATYRDPLDDLPALFAEFLAASYKHDG